MHVFSKLDIADEDGKSLMSALKMSQMEWGLQRSLIHLKSNYTQVKNPTFEINALSPHVILALHCITILHNCSV